jgi:hypothetical protein
MVMGARDIEHAFAKLRDAHESSLGVYWQMGYKAFGLEWAFYSFGRYPGAAKGNGAKALTEVCALADEFGIELSLWCEPVLIPYYQRFGFVTGASRYFVAPIMRRRLRATNTSEVA